MARPRLERPAGFSIPAGLPAKTAARKYGVSHNIMLRWAHEIGHKFPSYRATEAKRPDDFFLSANTSVAEACAEYGVSEKLIRRWAREIGHEFPGPNGRRASYREQVADMRPLDAVEFLLGVLERLDPDDASREIKAIRAHGFTHREAVFLLMMRRPYIAKEIAVARMSVDLDLPLSSHSVSRIVCGLRDKLAGYPVKIITEPDMGWRIERDPWFTFAWE